MQCPFCNTQLKPAVGQRSDLLYCPEECCGWTHVALPKKIWEIVSSEKTYRHKCYAYENAYKNISAAGGDKITLAQLKNEAQRLCVPNQTEAY